MVAAAGALIAAVAPAVMATADGSTLRGSVSDYWDVDPPRLFWLPFSVAAGLLFIDGWLSFSSPDRQAQGRRWHNVVLGIALAGLTWFNVDEQTVVHTITAVVFFSLFIVVIAYTSVLGWTGRHLETDDRPHSPEAEVVSAKVSLIFLGLLGLTLGAWWPLGLITFFFFEVFALVNFALFYVQGIVSPFPYQHYEFSNDALNRLLRRLHTMKT